MHQLAQDGLGPGLGAILGHKATRSSDSWGASWTASCTTPRLPEPFNHPSSMGIDVNLRFFKAPQQLCSGSQEGSLLFAKRGPTTIASAVGI